jgi:hypothetical protein
MAKRDPYHQSRCRYEWCSHCSDSDDVRHQIRRARHAGKREAHAAVIDQNEVVFESWYADFLVREAAHDNAEPCSSAEPSCFIAFATICDALT